MKVNDAVSMLKLALSPALDGDESDTVLGALAEVWQGLGDAKRAQTVRDLAAAARDLQAIGTAPALAISREIVAEIAEMLDVGEDPPGPAGDGEPPLDA